MVSVGVVPPVTGTEMSDRYAGCWTVKAHWLPAGRSIATKPVESLM